MPVSAIVRPLHGLAPRGLAPRGLALIVGLNRDRLLYAATIVLALWLGAALGSLWLA